MLRLAHRGDWRHAPENSLAAILAALEVPGCDGVEFDVRGSADGIPVLLHDASLARVQGRPEQVTELTAAALAAAGVPTLADVLGAVTAEAFLDVELKPGADPEAVTAVLAQARGPDLANAVISSFEPELLRGIARLRPGWPRWLNGMDLSPATVARAAELSCAAIAVEWHAIDEAAVARARAAGLDVAAWTVTDQAVADRLARQGVIAACVEGTGLGG